MYAIGDCVIKIFIPTKQNVPIDVQVQVRFVFFFVMQSAAVGFQVLATSTENISVYHLIKLLLPSAQVNTPNEQTSNTIAFRMKWSSQQDTKHQSIFFIYLFEDDLFAFSFQL